MISRLYQIVSLTALLLLSVTMTAAQQQCEAIVARTLQAVGENCDGTGRNEACYGFQQVEASFVRDVPDDFFTTPSDISPLVDIQTLRTAPLQIDENIWGVAVMKVQANVPNTLPGQNVTFMLIGDVEVQNAVDPEEARMPVDPIEVIVDVPSGANIRSGPGTNFNVVGGARPETPLEADGLSADRQWLRIAFNERPAWVSLTTVAVDQAALDSLPVVDAAQRTPMQAFYLRTGIGTAACEDVISDSLLIQGPENIEVSLTVNGADVNIGSTGVLRIVEIDGEFFLENIVFDGVWDWNGVQVRRGQRTRLCLGEEVDINDDGMPELEVTCEASEPEFIPFSQLANLYCNYETMPPGLLNYPLDIPCPDDPPAAGSGSSGTAGSPSQLPEVDCRAFAIPPQTIIATDFIFDWPDVPGADSYVVALYDQSGFELRNYTTGESRLPTNGGDWPPAGYVDVRAYRNGEYACFARLNFSRLPDPNPQVNEPQVTQSLSASLTSCIVSVPFADAGISWSGALSGFVEVFWDDFFGPQTLSFTGSSGSATIPAYDFANNIQVKSGSESVSLGSCP